MLRPVFRPQLQALEAREVPALNVLYTGASLTLTGTPAATGSQFLSVQNTGGDDYQVTDAGVDLGTYRITRDITVKLSSIDCNVGVNLNGDTLPGNLLIDVGAGDRDPLTRATVSLVTDVGSARVSGDVTFKGGSGQERFLLLTVDEFETPMDIGGNVRVIGNTVTTPIEDTFELRAGVTVHGDVRSDRITYTTISGTVDGNVIATATGSPGGMGFAVTRTGVVHGDVIASGGATAVAETDGTTYFSYADLGGTIDGDAILRLTSGRASIRTAPGGKIGGHLHYTAADGVDTDFSLASDTAIGGNLRYTAGNCGSNSVQLYGRVEGYAALHLGGPATVSSSLAHYGSVGKSFTVTGGGQWVSVQVVGFDWGGAATNHPTWRTVGGDLTVKTGNGTNSLTVMGANSQFNGEFGANPIGGKLTFTGGSGADTVRFDGQSTFKAKLDLGAGSDTVAFTPLATVGSLDVDFGAGLDTWTPPTVITFPLKLKNL